MNDTGIGRLSELLLEIMWRTTVCSVQLFKGGPEDIPRPLTQRTLRRFVMQCPYS